LNQKGFIVNKFVGTVSLVAASLFVLTGCTSSGDSEATPSPTPTLTASQVRVPDLNDLDGRTAAAKLSDMGLEYDFSESVWTSKNWKVTGTDPATDTIVEKGTNVVLIVTKITPSEKATEAAEDE
jgi:PBP1b-binding outer membrane lipoprotein LpoB